jgi:UDP-N-acetylglucosamine acyltransferase
MWPRAAEYLDRISMSIHATAIVSRHADVHPSATIGPFCIIEGRVEIGADTVVESHARVGHKFGRVKIGERNYIQNGAVLGGPPQDVSYRDADTALEIGNGNRIGEYVSVSLGTEKGGGRTVIGNDVLLMAFVHLGHDCRIDDHVIITNGTQLAGHVVVEDHALLSGLAGVTQFVRLGRYSFLTAGAFANKDIPPYTIAEGHWAKPRTVNRVGLKRAGFTTAERGNVEQAVRILLDSSLTIETVLERIGSECTVDAPVAHLLESLRSSSRGIARR